MKGFTIQEDSASSTCVGRLTLKSVRYDPVSGWITDAARLEYFRASDGALLGTVDAQDNFFTPTVESVFNALLEGSLRLWGRR
jgi:hypothetical protein